MRLDRLLDGVAVLDAPPGAPAIDVAAIAYDSRAVTPGALFCCVPGAAFDGHDFAVDAAAAGAVALLVERRVDVPVPQIVVSSVRVVMPVLACRLYGDPSRGLTVAGVTGTNGKTTVTHFLQAVFEAHGWRAAVIGTLSGTRTTPEAPDLQAQFARLKDDGMAAVATEVSSHALAQCRVDGTHFASATFTNLTQDHLDFHGTMDEYFAAKARLFEPDRAGVAIVNTDDAWGLRLSTMV
ncbi:MAG: Mur ligase family protein, partial [Micromonosporaceae bacterium]